MNTSEIVQLLEVVYLVFGLAFVFNAKYYKWVVKDAIKSKTTVLFWWYASLVIGFIIVNFYREWTLSGDGLITLLWWIALFKWVFALMNPQWFAKFSKVFLKWKSFNMMSYALTIVGILLMYYWFIVL